MFPVTSGTAIVASAS